MTNSSKTPLAPLAQSWLTLWNGDFSQAEALIAPDFRVHAALLGGGDGSALSGPQGLTRWIAQTRAALADLTFQVEVGPIGQGDLIALRWQAVGTYAGGFPGAAAPAGTAIAMSGTDLLRVRGGQLAEYWVNSDMHALLAQLQVKG